MHFPKTQFVTFCAGVLIGFGLFVFVSKNKNATKARNNLFDYVRTILEENRYKPIPSADNDASKRFLIENEETLSPFSMMQYMNENFTELDFAKSDVLYNEVRVLCWVLTSPKYHKSRAIHIKRTWGRRCNKLVFMSTKEDSDLGAEALEVKEGYGTLWGKTKKALAKIKEKYIDEADWFIKVDDDTFVVVENLRYFLSNYSTTEDHYFGCNFKLRDRPVYMSGGAGYVLSKSALLKFVDGLEDPKKCKKSDQGYEDVELGQCLKRVGVNADDSRDNLGRYRFLSFTPKTYLIPGSLPKNMWWWKYIQYPQKKGIDCCSPTAIAFHYVSPHDMYLYDFLLYYLRPVGVKRELEEGDDEGENSEAVDQTSYIPPTSDDGDYAVDDEEGDEVSTTTEMIPTTRKTPNLKAKSKRRRSKAANKNKSKKIQSK